MTNESASVREQVDECVRIHRVLIIELQKEVQANDFVEDSVGHQLVHLLWIPGTARQLCSSIECS